jgi:MFS family permease
MAHDCFISYSSKDKATADAVCATLESRGIRCWIAPRDVLPGEEYAAALVSALHHSKLLVLVFSSGANQSPQVLRELERAVSRGLPIIPLRIEDVPPSAAMEYYISSRHWLDALTTPLERHLVSLAETVKVLLGRMNEAAEEDFPPAVRPVPPLPQDELPRRSAVPRPLAPSVPEPAIFSAPPIPHIAVPVPAPAAAAMARAPEPPAAPNAGGPAFSAAAAPAMQQPATAPRVSPAGPRAETAVGSQRVLAILASIPLGLVLGARFDWDVTRNFGIPTSDVRAIIVLGRFAVIAGFITGGLLLKRFGARKLAVSAVILFTAGTLLFPLSKSLVLYILGYQMLAAFANGAGTIVLLASMLRWFPGHPGRAAALVTATLAFPALIVPSMVRSMGMFDALLTLGILFVIFGIAPGFFLYPAPPGYAGPDPKKQPPRAREYTLVAALGNWRWYGLGFLLFLNALAAAFVTAQAMAIAYWTNGSSLEELVILALGTFLGRLGFPWLADVMRSRWLIFSLCLLQALLVLVLPIRSGLDAFMVVAFLVALCNGGIFGSLPALEVELFGDENIAPIYGLTLPAWSFAGLFSMMILLGSPPDSAQAALGGASVVAVLLLLAAIAIPFLRTRTAQAST